MLSTQNTIMNKDNTTPKYMQLEPRWQWYMK